MRHYADIDVCLLVCAHNLFFRVYLVVKGDNRAVLHSAVGADLAFDFGNVLNDDNRIRPVGAKRQNRRGLNALIAGGEIYGNNGVVELR